MSSQLSNSVGTALSKSSKVRLLAFIGVLVATHGRSIAAVGDALDNFDAAMTANVPGCTTTGIAFDGTNLILDCHGSNKLFLVSPRDPHGLVATLTIQGLPFGNDLKAMAWDRTRQRLWACNQEDRVVLIDLATQSTTPISPGVSSIQVAGCHDGLAYDPADDTLWASPDVSPIVYHYRTDGTLIESIRVHGLLGSCDNSGIAICGTHLLLANDGCSEIYDVARDGTGSTRIALFDRRLEDLECDATTFAPKVAVWSQDAFDHIINAWEVPETFAPECDVEYAASSGDLPDRASPSWTPFVTGNATAAVVGGSLQLSDEGDPGYLVTYERSLQAPLPSPLVLEARVRVDASDVDPNVPREGTVLQAVVAPITGTALYIGKDRIFLLTGNSTRGPAAPVPTGDRAHDYRMEIADTGVVSVFYDGRLLLSGRTFRDADAFDPVPLFRWGQGTILGGGRSSWDFVRYNLSNGPCDQLTDVRIVDTIALEHNDIVDGTYSEPPFRVTPGSKSKAVEWHLSTMAVGTAKRLSFDVSLRDLIPGEMRLVNKGLAVDYVDPLGKATHRELGEQFVTVRKSVFDIAVTTDKMSYVHDELVHAKLIVTLQGTTPRTVDIPVVVQDTAHAQVAEVTTLRDVPFTAGETKTFDGIVFDTADTLSGEYRIVATLREDATDLGTGAGTFTIVPDATQPLVTSSVVTDKGSYVSHEQVRLSSRVTNVTPNVVLTDLSVRVHVAGPGGAGVSDQSRTIVTLVPGARSDGQFLLDTATLPAGTYTVVQNVQTIAPRAGASSLLSTAMAKFVIESAPDAGVAIGGTITASPKVLELGGDLRLDYGVTNVGNVRLQNVRLTQSIVDPGTSAIVTTFDGMPPFDLDLGESHSESQSVHRPMLAPKSYLVVLQATVGDTAPVSVAHDGFTVVASGAATDVKCYGVKFTPPRGHHLVGPMVTLTDRFETTRGDVTKPTALCKSVTVDGPTPPSPSADLVCYDMRRRARLSEPTLTLRDRFGVQTISVKRNPKVCAPAVVDRALSAPDRDYVECYAIRPSSFVPRTVGLVDAFETRSVKVRRPVMVCDAAARDGRPIRNPNAYLTCYSIYAGNGQQRFTERSVTTQDGFRPSQQLRVEQPELLCVTATALSGSSR